MKIEDHDVVGNLKGLRTSRKNVVWEIIQEEFNRFCTCGRKVTDLGRTMGIN